MMRSNHFALVFSVLTTTFLVVNNSLLMAEMHCLDSKTTASEKDNSVPVNSTVTGKTYYISTSGNDRNAGSINAPFATLQKAANTVGAGDIVYIRGGIYFDEAEFYTSGIPGSPIRILAYPSEYPILDGNNYTRPGGQYTPLLMVSGDYVSVSDLEVRYSSGMGVCLSGKHDTADNIRSHHNMENGILITGDYGVVQYCNVYSNCMSNYGGTAPMNSTGLSAARHPNYATIRKNKVYDNWGEGLSTFEANGITIQDNTVYDNWSANVYISDVTNVVFERNLVYTTRLMNNGSQVGIMLGDEVYSPASANIIIINNISYSNKRNFYWWQGLQGGGMNNVLIANNTFVNSTEVAGVQINDGTHRNVLFENNIVEQDGGLPVILTVSNQGLHYINNLWSKSPGSAASGTGDIIGDPKLWKNGESYRANWFKLDSVSPAINKGIEVSPVTTDFELTPRPQYKAYDIGAFEYRTSGTSNLAPSILQTEDKAKLVIYPNPSDGIFDMRFTGDARQTLRIALTDMTGKIVFKENIICQNGDFSRHFDLSYLKNGLYIMSLVSGLNVYTCKIILGL